MHLRSFLYDAELGAPARWVLIAFLFGGDQRFFGEDVHLVTFKILEEPLDDAILEGMEADDGDPPSLLQ